MSEPGPTITESFDGPTFEWSDWGGVRVKTYSYSDKRGELTAEYLVYHPPDNLLTHGRLNLLSNQARSQLIKECHGHTDQVEWRGIFEYVCLHGKKWFRQGESEILLDGHLDELVDPWRLNPLVSEFEPTVVYGPGGSGKSCLGLFCGMLVQRGSSLAGLAGVQGNVLYLDWESDERRMQERRLAIGKGNAFKSGDDPWYRRCVQPLADDVRAVQEIIHKRHIKFVVIDSLAMAAGGDNLLEPATRFYAALRRLKVASLIIAHVAKHGEERSIYGSVFFSNLARSTWEIEKIQEAGQHEIQVRLTHNKVNYSDKFPSLSFRIRFADQVIEVDAMASEDFVPINPKLGKQHEKLAQALQQGKQTLNELALATGFPKKTVTALLTNPIYQQKYKWERHPDATLQIPVWHIPGVGEEPHEEER